MGFFEVFLIGVGLSMDAAAISMTNSMVYTKDRKKLALLPVFFGLFQALMPLIGFFVGHLFAGFVEKYAGVITFVILAVIGGNMIREAINGEVEKEQKALAVKLIILQAIATSIDAFAAGITFGMAGSGLDMNIFAAVVLIGITTFLFSAASVLLGRKFGKMLESKAEILGGIILVAIGIKALLGF